VSATASPKVLRRSIQGTLKPTSVEEACQKVMLTRLDLFFKGKSHLRQSFQTLSPLFGVENIGRLGTSCKRAKEVPTRGAPKENLLVSKNQESSLSARLTHGNTDLGFASFHE
jgi:hypothetical protein